MLHCKISVYPRLFRGECGPGLRYSVDLRIQTYTEPVPLKYGKLATNYPWKYAYLFPVYRAQRGGEHGVQVRLTGVHDVVSRSPVLAVIMYNSVCLSVCLCTLYRDCWRCR